MTRRLAASALAAGLLLTAAGASAAAATESTHPGHRAASADHATSAVIVLAAPGQRSRVERAAVRLGATVTRPLDIVNGFAARMSPTAQAELRTVSGVVSVSADRTMRPMSIAPTLGYDPADLGSSSSVTQLVGAQSAWAAGLTGKGVDVALIDTGVARVPGLAGTGQVLDGPDLSFDQTNAVSPGLDAYGHGTFMASLIGGRDATAKASGLGCTTCLNSSGYSDTTKFVGVAPESRIINVKVGAADGATDVSQVIAAIDWVTQHAHDPGINIRVLNLSFGTSSTQSYQVDPLAQAAEQAWRHGIVVVAAAGNEGRTTPSLADPAYDPYVLAVGGDDPKGTLTTTDDVVASFAQHGNATRNVDVIAPATHVLGLRVPGSFIDTLSGNTGQVGDRFQRGSGTSEATAIVSGAMALLAQRFPLATPDQLKALLSSSATPLPVITSTPALQQLAAALKMTTEQYVATLNAINTQYSGHGIANLQPTLTALLPISVQLAPASTGTGTLDGSRGGVYVVDNGVNLTGQKDIFGKPFTSATMALAQTAGTSWIGGIWNGSRWTGDGWSGSRWSTASWTGTDWAGVKWTGSRWSGMTWSGAKWTGSGWNGSRWSSSTWDGSRWSSASWN